MLSLFFDDLVRGKSTIVIGLVVIVVFVGLILYFALYASNAGGDGRNRRATLMVLAPIVLLGAGGWAFYHYDRYAGFLTPSSSTPIWDRPGPWGESDRAAKLADRAQQQLRAGDVDGARLTLESALDSYRRARNLLGEARTLGAIGDIDRRLGRYETARAAYGDSLVLLRKDNSRAGIANTMRGLGELERQMGNSEAATAAYSEARELIVRSAIGMRGQYAAELCRIAAQRRRRRQRAQGVSRCAAPLPSRTRPRRPGLCAPGPGRPRPRRGSVRKGAHDLRGRPRDLPRRPGALRRSAGDARARRSRKCSARTQCSTSVLHRGSHDPVPRPGDVRRDPVADRLSLVERQSNNAAKAIEWSRGANAVATQARDAVSMAALAFLAQHPADAPPAYMRARYFPRR